MTDQMNRRTVIFEWLALLAIVTLVSVTTFDTDIPHLWEATWGPENGWIDDVAYVAVIFFAFEYVIRVWTASDKRKYIFSFFGIIDLLAVVIGIAALATVHIAEVVQAAATRAIVEASPFQRDFGGFGKGFFVDEGRDRSVLQFDRFGVVFGRIRRLPLRTRNSTGAVQPHGRRALVGGCDFDHRGIRRHLPGDDWREDHDRRGCDVRVGYCCSTGRNCGSGDGDRVTGKTRTAGGGES